jgi:hypothetical protein
VAQSNAKIMAMVERAMKRDPSIATRDLYERAVEQLKEIGELTVRQFHGRYALPAKRKLSPPKPAKKKAGKPPKKSRQKQSSGRKSRRQAKPSQPAAAPAITEIVESRIKEQRAKLDEAAAGAAERAMKSGRLADIDKLSRALTRAAGELSKV